MPVGAFKTGRLSARPWHEAALGLGLSLERIVSVVLTEPVTRTLPPGWQGPYDEDKARGWIRDRDEESEVLLLTASDASREEALAAEPTDKMSERPVGFMILFQQGNDNEVRIGYLLAEDAWGKGYATEAVTGLVEACRTNPAVRWLVGGVDADNVASARVLERNGFREVPKRDGFDGTAGKERFFRLQV